MLPSISTILFEFQEGIIGKEKTKVSRTLAEALISSRLHRPRSDPLGASLPSNWNPRERWEKENRRKVPYLIFHIGGAAWIFLRVCKASRKRYPTTESFFPSRSRGLLSRAKNRESNPAALDRNPHRPSFISSRTISRSRILHRSPSKNRPREKIIRDKSRSWWKSTISIMNQKNIMHDIVITIESTFPRNLIPLFDRSNDWLRNLFPLRFDTRSGQKISLFR